MDGLEFKIYLLENKRVSNDIRIRNLTTLLDSYSQLQMIEESLFKRAENLYQERDNRIKEINGDIGVCQNYNEQLITEIAKLQKARLLF